MKPRAGVLMLALLGGILLEGCHRRSKNGGGDSAIPIPPPQSMTQMDAVSYQGPTLLWNVKSPRADVQDDQETLFLYQPDMKSFKNGHLDSTLTSEKGWLNTTQQTMLAQDNVVIISTDGARLEAPWVIIDNRTQIIHSTATARIIRPGSITIGNNLVATMNLSSVSMSNEVVQVPKQKKTKQKT